MPSRCSGWSVQELIAHTGSGFKGAAEPGSGSTERPPIAEDLQELLARQRRDWTADHLVAEIEAYRQPASVVVEGSSPHAAATATSSAVEFVLWGTTRVPWGDLVSVDGDRTYAPRVLDRINIV